jgi:hypothetical protein
MRTAVLLVVAVVSLAVLPAAQAANAVPQLPEGEYVSGWAFGAKLNE